MRIFTVKRSKKNDDFIVQMPINNLFGVIASICKSIPYEELKNDNNYILRMSSNGVMEVGYKEDKWHLS